MAEKCFEVLIRPFTEEKYFQHEKGLLSKTITKMSKHLQKAWKVKMWNVGSLRTHSPDVLCQNSNR